MQALLHAFLKAYLPKEIILPETYHPESKLSGIMAGPNLASAISRSDDMTYTFATAEMANAFVKAMQPFLFEAHGPLIANNVVSLSSRLFLEVMKIASGPVLNKYKEFLSPITYHFQPDERDVFQMAKSQPEKADAIVAELQEVGIKASSYRGLIYMRRAHESNFDIEKLAAQVQKHPTGNEYQSFTAELQTRRAEAIAMVKKVVTATGREKEFYFSDDYRGFRVLSKNKQLVEDFSAKFLIGQYDYNWSPEDNGRAWQRGGDGSAYNEFLVIVDLEKFSKLYKASKATVEHKAPEQALQAASSVSAAEAKALTGYVKMRSQTAVSATEQKQDHSILNGRIYIDCDGTLTPHGGQSTATMEEYEALLSPDTDFITGSFKSEAEVVALLQKSKNLKLMPGVVEFFNAANQLGFEIIIVSRNWKEYIRGLFLVAGMTPQALSEIIIIDRKELAEKPPETAKQLAVEHHEATSPKKCKRAIVADDDQGDCKGMVAALKSAGYQDNDILTFQQPAGKFKFNDMRRQMETAFAINKTYPLNVSASTVFAGNRYVKLEENKKNSSSPKQCCF